MAQVTHIQADNFTNPIGLDSVSPRFSWTLEGDYASLKQNAYRILVRDAYLSPVWDSGRVVTSMNRDVEYKGMALLPRSRYLYKVWVWNDKNDVFESEEQTFETGLMQPDGFTGKWITAPVPTKEESVWRLRRSFRLNSVPERARAYTTAHGLYHLFVNGRRVSEDEFTPGWTSYNKRLQYQTYDITPYLQQGENVLAVELADGWYKGRIGWLGGGNVYGTQLEFLGRFVLGNEQIHTDDSWVCAQAPYAYAGIYHGLSYDASADCPDWNAAGFDDSSWNRVSFRERTENGIVSQENHPARRREFFRPVEMIITPKGEKVIDFGQNLVGWVELSLHANRGDKVELSHAEVLDAEGNFYTENYRTSEAKFVYICSGAEKETFRPDLSYFGFRYVRLDAFPQDADPMESLTAAVVYSDMEQTAGFETNDPTVNQLFSNIVWGQKGNFLEAPTDCPQRDERLGWTGDAQVFSRTAATLMDTRLFFAKWLRDLAADQREDGGVPHVIPDVLFGEDHSATGWADAAVVIPWNLYEVYGDRKILQEQYPSMKAWVEYMRARDEEGLLWTKGRSHYGDWLALDVPFGTYRGATDMDYIGCAFYAHSCELLVKAAEVLGYKADVKEYGKLHKTILRAFRHEFVTRTGRLAVKTQTACVLALQFNLVKQEHRARVMDMLTELLEKADMSLTTGFLGTPYLCRVLTHNGRHDLAARLFLRREYPSWLYPISKGATTMWEHWDGIRPDGSFWSKNMNSYNHYAYGSIAEWMIRDLAGIDTNENHPGYDHILLHPLPCEGLDYARCWVRTPNGRVVCGWEKKNDLVEIDVEVPWNSTALLTLPASLVLDEKSNEADASEGICLTAGSYHFCYQIKE